MTKVIKQIGPKLFNIGNPGVSFDKLPIGQYTVRYSDDLGMYLEGMDISPLPETLYIDTELPDYWLKSYRARKSNVGILMSGIKGTGKTVTAKYLCKKSGLPVIVINPLLDIPAQLNYINQKAVGDFVLFMDEFEKIVKQDKNNVIAPILTFLDGNNVNNVLSIICVNGYVSEFLTGRLGRVLFSKKFAGLSKKQITNVINDFINEDLKDQANDIAEYLMNNLEQITIDNIVNIVKELNLGVYGIEKLLNLLNVDKPRISCTMYEIVDGMERKLDFNPIISQLSELEEMYIGRRNMLDKFYERITKEGTVEHEKYYSYLKQEAERTSSSMKSVFNSTNYSNHAGLNTEYYKMEVKEKTKDYVIFGIMTDVEDMENSPFNTELLFKVYYKPWSFNNIGLVL